MSVKAAGTGHFTIPAQPAAGTSVTSGAANNFTASYVTLQAAGALAALYITGVFMEAAAADAATYNVVQLATGTAGSEVVIGQYLVPMITGSTVARGYRAIFPPIPVALNIRIAAKTVDSVGSLAKLITLECILQSNVVDDGIAVTTVTTVTNQLTAAAIATGVWQDAVGTDFTTASSIGKSLYTGNFAPGAASGLQINGANTGPVSYSGGMSFTNSGGDALTITSSGSNGNGINISANGTGAGIVLTPGATGHGIQAKGGATSGDAINATATTSGHGITATGTGTTKHGINATGGTTTSDGIRATGGGVGYGINAQSGTGAAAEGIRAVSNAASGLGNGIAGYGAFTGDGIQGTGGATGRGLHLIGGATSGSALRAEGTAGNALGFEIIGQGSAAGIQTTGGATGQGALIIGGGTSGDGIKVTTTSGHGLNLAPVGTNMHGILSTGGNGGISDGIKAAAGTGGVDIRGNITGNLVGTVSTLTTYTGDTPQTGDTFARIGAAGAGLTALGDTRIANLDATVSSRMASYTQPTGFLAATFPSSVASPTNITAGTIATVTNLTNAPTAGDFTATMKTSLNAATPASVTGAVGSVTGNVGGSVASVTARVTANSDQINGDATSAANLAKTTKAIGRGTVGSSATTTSIPTSAFSPSGAVADQFKNRIILFDANTTTAALQGQIASITASSNSATPTFTVTPLAATAVSGDVFSVI